MYEVWRRWVRGVRVIGELFVVVTLGVLGIMFMIMLMGIIAGCQPVNQ